MFRVLDYVSSSVEKLVYTTLYGRWNQLKLTDIGHRMVLFHPL
jgi:hypothetical protein